MEDILASIRRILDEEGKPKMADDEEDASTAPDDGVLELEESMLLPDTDQREPEPLPTPPQPDPVVPPRQNPPSQIALPSLAAPEPAGDAGPDLVAPAAAAAAAMSVGALMRTLANERSTAVSRSGPTIEELVREEIRPLLKEWLDMHLPPLVERLVRAEIERVVSRTA